MYIHKHTCCIYLCIYLYIDLSLFLSLLSQSHSLALFPLPFLLYNSDAQLVIEEWVKPIFRLAKCNFRLVPSQHRGYVRDFVQNLSLEGMNCI